VNEDTQSSIELAAKSAFIVHSRRAISEVLSELSAPEDSFDKVLDTSARLLHTIKGGAAFLKLREIASIAAALEHIIRCETVGSFPGLIQKIKDGLRELESKIQEIDCGSRSDEFKDLASSK